MKKNAVIPLAVLRRIFYLLEQLDADDFVTNVMPELLDVRKFLNLKLQRVESRLNYEDARSAYLNLKECLCIEMDELPF